MSAQRPLETDANEFKLRPSARAVCLLTALGVGSLALSAADHAIGIPLAGFWQALLLTLMIALLFLLLADYWSARHRVPVTVQRQLRSSLALNKWTEVALTIRHTFTTPTTVEIFDGINDTVRSENAHMTVVLHPQKSSQQTYRIRPLVRGPLFFEYCAVKIPSALGFWRAQYRLPARNHSKVYPDFAAVTAYNLLAVEQHTSELGIRRRSRRGQGLDFHQLREYRQGDSLRQVDWKGTSRRQKLIAKEYQDERDQNVILLIDSGRRMRVKDDALDHFDHALNAALLVTYIALRQGDSVGVMSFGNSDRWLPPQKGSQHINVILNGLYDLQASNSAPDYVAAAEKLTLLQRKRSLVILVTNSRDEEIDEMMMAVNLLRKRHLVMIANIREASLDQTQRESVESEDQAAAYAGTIAYLMERSQVYKKIQANGTLAVDCLAKDLAPALANSYWEIKRAGIL